MTIKGDLTTKDVMDRFKDMDDRYGMLVKDIGYALGKLDETKKELQEAKYLYEKGIFRGLIKKCPKFCICAFALIVITIILAGLYYLKDKEVKVKSEALNQTSTLTIYPKAKENIKK